MEEPTLALLSLFAGVTLVAVQRGFVGERLATPEQVAVRGVHQSPAPPKDEAMIVIGAVGFERRHQVIREREFAFFGVFDEVFVLGLRPHL